MRSRSLALTVLSLLVCFSNIACSPLIQKPTATFKSAELRRPGPDGVTIDFHVDVANSNPVSVPMSGAQYKLALGGAQVLDSKVATTGDLPAKGTLPLTLPVTLSFENLLAAQEAIRQSGGDVPYHFDGALEFKLAGAAGLAGPVRVPLQFSGTLPLKQVLKDPSVLLQSPAARKLAEKLLGSF